MKNGSRPADNFGVTVANKIRTQHIHEQARGGLTPMSCLMISLFVYFSILTCSNECE